MSIYADLVVPVLEAVVARRMRIAGGRRRGRRGASALYPALSRSGSRPILVHRFGPVFVQRRRAPTQGKRLRFARRRSRPAVADQGLLPEKLRCRDRRQRLARREKICCFSLREIYNILKPNGYLILPKARRQIASGAGGLDVVFAFLRGWWDVSTDRADASRPGFLLPSEWQRALADLRFRLRCTCCRVRTGSGPVPRRRDRCLKKRARMAAGQPNGSTGEVISWPT